MPHPVVDRPHISLWFPIQKYVYELVHIVNHVREDRSPAWVLPIFLEADGAVSLLGTRFGQAIDERTTR